MDRRLFLWAMAASALSTLPSTSLPAAPTRSSKARVLIVGGGMAGASAAKYLRMWGDSIDVTLIERQATYTSNIMSNLVLTGQRTLPGLAYRYDTLQRRYGVRLIVDDVVDVDPVATSITLASGKRLAADRIILAPGIDFDPVLGLADSSRMPHAWQAGPQTTLLAQQLAALPAGGVVAITVPRMPYRCPPGPYERACLVADWLKENKPRAKLILIDANPDIAVEKENFQRAFRELYGDIMEYRNGVDIASVDAKQMTLTTSSGPVRADVINLIPRQRAAALVANTGLATDEQARFAPVDVLSYVSSAAPNVHVIGDSCGTTQPMAGQMANQQAKVCADALTRIFAGQEPDPAPVTNSACYSTITRSEAGWMTAVFQYDPAARVMKPAAEASAASNGWTRKNFKQMNKWFDALMADTFA
ncbi:MAG: FAD/NAD(P)-binding oxidoreductase [Gammaproteobacteria bacterium]